MKPIVITGVPFEIDEERLFKTLHMEKDSPDADTVRRLADEAARVARPKAVCGMAYIDATNSDSVLMEGVEFTSHVLAVNLSSVHRVFPYVATCGTELEEWARSIDDMLTRWYADGIMQMALGPALAAATKRIEEEFHPGKTAVMNPGSLADWPISEQRPLWRLLQDPTSSIGVTLTDSFLMIPAKSVSGIRFPSETTYENCQLCPRETCPGRRAPYDKGLYERKYGK